VRQHPFTLSTFLSGWFLLYFLIRQVAMFGATSIVVVNVLGILVLGEVLSLQAYLAIGLVVLGFIVLSMSP
jgi:uncharacterized membrane protein